ncbi:MAG: GNAT family N-acetyltransferase [Blastocatellia bacterium]
MNLEFKPAIIADAELLLEMMRDFYAHEELVFEKTAARRALEGLINDSSFGRVVLICNEAEVIGYAVLTFGYSLEFHGRDAFVDEIYLREDARGQGMGQRVLAYLTEVCAENGVRALHLEVERKNAAAQSAYRKFGFEDHDRYLMTKWI